MFVKEQPHSANQNGEEVEPEHCIPHFDLPTIYRIVPFIKVDRDLDDLNVSLKKLFKDSKKTFS